MSERDASVSERDLKICRAYQVDGEKVSDIAAIFGISPTRVRQILQEQKVYVPYRDTVARKTGRRAFVGVEVTQDAKTALQEKAKENGKSVSRFLSDTIEDIVK